MEEVLSLWHLLLYLLLNSTDEGPAPWLYFAVISMSGAFSVTFLVIFGYVTDVTQEHERDTAYG